jgi:hypothetical protein
MNNTTHNLLTNLVKSTKQLTSPENLEKLVEIHKSTNNGNDSTFRDNASSKR